MTKKLSNIKNPVFLAALLFGFAHESFACAIADDVIDSRYKEAEGVYVGYIIGIEYLGFAKEASKRKLFDEVSSHPICTEERYKVLVKDTLKGEPKENVYFNRDYCGNMEIGPKKKVIVYTKKTGNSWALLSTQLYNRVISNKRKNDKLSDTTINSDT